jgi:hypothetical protein
MPMSKPLYGRGLEEEDELPQIDAEVLKPVTLPLGCRTPSSLEGPVLQQDKSYAIIGFRFAKEHPLEGDRKRFDCLLGDISKNDRSRRGRRLPWRSS